MVKLYDINGKVLYNFPQFKDLRDAVEDAVRLGFNLEGIDLSSQNLSGCDLRGMYAPDSKFSNAIMQNCDLRGADLTGSDMSCCYLLGSCLSRATMCNVNFQGADLSNCSIIGADMSFAKFISTDIDGAIIEDCSMDNITWKKYVDCEEGE